MVLTYDGAMWRPAAIPPATETDPSVLSFAKTALPSCPAGQVLSSNGASFNCQNSFSGTPYKIVTTGTGGELVTSTPVSLSELSYLAGVTSSIQTQLDGKSSAGSFIDWSTAGVQTIELSRIQLPTNSMIAISDATGKLTTSTVQVSALANLVGVASPLQAQIDNKANTTYVDSFAHWTKSGADAYMPTGRVGIGTSSPLVALDVSGDIQTTGQIKTQLLRVSQQGSPSSPNLALLSDPATGIFYPSGYVIGFSQNGTETMRIAANGNVGIGTASPAEKLTVMGSVSGTSNFINASDRRYKKDIRRIESSLEKLLLINGVRYSFRTEQFPEKNFSAGKQLGVIAQDVEKVFPEAVSKDSKGFLSVAYSALIAPVIEAIREMDGRQRELEEENRILKDYLCAKDSEAPFCH